MTRRLVAALIATLLVVALSGDARAQAFPDLDGAAGASSTVTPRANADGAAASLLQADAMELGSTLAARLADPASADEGEVTPISGTDGRLSAALEIAVLLTALSLLPAVLITLTSFTRIVIVLSFVRRALSLNELPPNQILIGLALFLTIFVMAPVGEKLYAEAWTPYDSGEIQLEEASGRAWSTLSTFLVANTRENELRLFAELADSKTTFAFLDAGTAGVLAAEAAGGPMPMSDVVADAPEVADLPLTVVIPAFILSELKTAFQMGFLLFLPFLVIDLVVSSILLSMGMFMLPPVMVSTPIKVLVFVLVDGWRLVTESVVSSFVQTVGG